MSQAKRKLSTGSTYFGCDPEFFFLGPDGNVVGAEKVIPEKGLDLLSPYEEQLYEEIPNSGGRLKMNPDGSYIKKGEPFRRVAQSGIIVIDGIQAEMNTQPYGCRQALAGNIAQAFQQLKEHLTKNAPDIKATLQPFVELKGPELEGLSDRSRILGCSPSLNYYSPNADLGVDPMTYMKRSAGGHIHLGFSSDQRLFKRRERLVPILDILVGNTSVLIDRDPHAAERRQVYGRAGEYRLPKHGLEYRTLSNYWLTSYTLTSLVMGLCRLAINVMATDTKRPERGPHNKYTEAQWELNYPSHLYWNAENTLLKMFGVKPDQKPDRAYLYDVQYAINNNDVDLAWKNWAIVRRFIEDHVERRGNGGNVGLDPGSLDNFEFFARTVQKKGLSFFFPGDPIDNWALRADPHRNTPGQPPVQLHSGAETFFSTTLNEIKAKEFEAEKVIAAVGPVEVKATDPVKKRTTPRGPDGRFVKKAA